MCHGDLEVIEMRVITGLIFMLLAFSACGPAQRPFTILIPKTPRVLIVEIPAGEKVPKTIENKESFSRSDPTNGYIENQAWPRVPRVWLLVGGEKVLLVGETTEGSPKKVLDWQILEFSLPPGLRQIIVEWWEDLPHHGGWRQVKTKIVAFQVACLRQGYWSGYGNSSHYNWSVIIRPDDVFVYECGRAPWYGHGRRGW